MQIEEEGTEIRAFSLTAVLVVGLAPAFPADAADPALGEKIYLKRCASCHAADGRGNAKMAGILCRASGSN